MRMTTRDRSIKPASPLVAMDDGRIDAGKWRHALHIAGAVLGFIVGAGIYAVSAPGEFDYSPGAWRYIGSYAGGALAIASGGYGVVWFAIDLWSMIAYQAFLTQARQVELENRRENKGIEIEESVTEWELDTENVRDLIVAVISFQLAANHNEQGRWTHRSLTENGLWFGRRKLADVTDWQARRLPDVLSKMGYIEGRSGEMRQAGDWAIKPVDHDLYTLADVAESMHVDTATVRRAIAMGLAVERLQKALGKVM